MYSDNETGMKQKEWKCFNYTVKVRVGVEEQCTIFMFFNQNGDEIVKVLDHSSSQKRCLGNGCNAKIILPICCNDDQNRVLYVSIIFEGVQTSSNESIVE